MPSAPLRSRPSTAAATTAGPRLLRRVRRIAQRHRRGLKFAILLTCGLGVGAASSQITPREALARGEGLAAQWGFGLDQVTVSGHRFTADSDVFAALGQDDAQTLLSLDMAQARARIEALPWVERATLSRQFPNTLSIVIVERRAAARWQTGAATLLLDRAGRRLGYLSPADDGRAHGSSLLRLEGEGADLHLDEAWALLARYPGLSHRLDRFERVAGRRWTMHLVNGRQFHLPADGADQALGLALELERRPEFAQARAIDLRVATSPLVLGLDGGTLQPDPLPQRTPPRPTTPLKQPTG